MTAMDTRARATALRSITKRGKACTLTGNVAGSYDPATGTAGNTATPVGVMALLTAVNANELKGGALLSDQAVLIPASGLSVDPAPEDSFTINSVVWRVKTVERYWSGEQVFMYRLVVRK